MTYTAQPPSDKTTIAFAVVLTGELTQSGDDIEELEQKIATVIAARLGAVVTVSHTIPDEDIPF